MFFSSCIFEDTMIDTPVAAAALYGSVFILVRYMTLLSKAAQESKRALSVHLPRPKSFLMSEKGTSMEDKVACKLHFHVSHDIIPQRMDIPC